MVLRVMSLQPSYTCVCVCFIPSVDEASTGQLYSWSHLSSRDIHQYSTPRWSPPSDQGTTLVPLSNKIEHVFPRNRVELHIFSSFPHGGTVNAYPVKMHTLFFIPVSPLPQNPHPPLSKSRSATTTATRAQNRTCVLVVFGVNLSTHRAVRIRCPPPASPLLCPNCWLLGNGLNAWHSDKRVLLNTRYVHKSSIWGSILGGVGSWSTKIRSFRAEYPLQYISRWWSSHFTFRNTIQDKK